MSKIFLTSDTHFGHDREFLWGPRGFDCSLEHDETIIRNWNLTVEPEDTVYVLGDLMLGNNDYGCECVARLNGHIKLIRGNHDSDKRWNEVYADLPNMERVGWADVIHYRKYHFYLSHFPTDTANYDDDDKNIWAKIISISGHTHKKEKFHNNNPMKYNVALDAHNNYPVLLDDIIADIKSTYLVISSQTG